MGLLSAYLLDNKHHNLPHIHARYAEFEASINIGDGEVLARAVTETIAFGASLDRASS